LINFVDATNDANHYTKPPPGCVWRGPGRGCFAHVYLHDSAAGHYDKDVAESNCPFCSSQ